MTQMTMGANIPLTAAVVRAVLQWSGGPGVPDVDVSAILLDDSGEVASDADFVFYNQPEHYSGAVRLAGKTPGAQSSDVVDVTLGAVPAGVEKIVLAASSDGGPFGQVPNLMLQLVDGASGTQLAYFSPTPADETAYVTGEFYRRDGAWKFRAVGQGYASGLAGLAADFGIDVGEPDEPGAPPADQPADVTSSTPPPLPPLPPLPAPAAPPAAAPPPPPPPVVETPPPPVVETPPPPVVETPPPPPPPPPVVETPPPPPPPPLDLAPPAPPAAPTDPLDLAPPAPPIPPPPPPAAPFDLTPPAAPEPPAAPPPPQPPVPPPAAAPPAAPATPAPGLVSLVKNQRVNLAQTSATPLNRLVFSLGWTPTPGKGDTDLDASVIAFDASGKKLAIVWYMHMSEFYGALQHTGDNRGTRGQSGVEQVLVDLSRMPPNVHALVFTINSFRGQTFTDIASAYCVVQNFDGGAELVRFDLHDTQPSTALLMSVLRRTPNGGWDMRAIGEFHDFRTVKKLLPAAERQVHVN